MSTLQSIDLIVPDVPMAVRFFRDVVGLQVLQEFDRFAELEGKKIKIMLSPDALVQIDHAAGIILHFEVDDIDAATARAAAAGAVILKGPIKTDWGTESVLMAGPTGIVVDLFCEL